MYYMENLVNRFLDFLKYEKRYSQFTIKSYANDLNQFLKFIHHHSVQVNDVDKVDKNTIRSFILYLKDNKYNNNSINRKIATLKSFYNFLYQKAIITKNVAQGILMLKKEKKLPVIVSEVEMQQIENFLNQNNYTFSELRDQVVIELLYGTGIRLSELVNLKDINFQNNFSKLKVLGKGNKERIIPIHSKLQILLSQYWDEKKKLGFEKPELTFIVTNTGKNCYRMFIQRIVFKYLAKICNHLERKSPHVIRHTFASHLLNNQADITSIKELLGHSSLAATQIYTHTDIEKLKLVFEKFHPKS
jgi:integrase/recombinase XerC